MKKLLLFIFLLSAGSLTAVDHKNPFDSGQQQQIKVVQRWRDTGYGDTWTLYRSGTAYALEGNGHVYACQQIVVKEGSGYDRLTFVNTETGRTGVLRPGTIIYLSSGIEEGFDARGGTYAVNLILIPSQNAVYLNDDGYRTRYVLFSALRPL